LDFEQFIHLNDNAKSELAALSDRIAVLSASIVEIESKEMNILQAIESGAKFPQFEARVRQLAEDRLALEIELRTTKEQYNVRANAKVDMDAVRSSIEDLLKRMSELQGDDLYDLRALLSQQIKRVVARIAVYAGGYIEKKEFIEGLRNHLKKAGYKPKDIDEHIAAKFKSKPDVTSRFFTMVSHNASARMIKRSRRFTIWR
jgi:alanyl-tRNA synthetase